MSRNAGAAFLRWSILTLIGVVGGIMLGELAVGTNARGFTDDAPSYSHLSANPDALVQQGGGGAAPCADCPDSYGVAMRLRAHPDKRMGDEFRELGAVDNDIDPPLPVDSASDYRFGGRFPDPVPEPQGTVKQDEKTTAAAPATDTPPADEAPVPVATE